MAGIYKFDPQSNILCFTRLACDAYPALLANANDALGKFYD